MPSIARGRVVVLVRVFGLGALLFFSHTSSAFSQNARNRGPFAGLFGGNPRVRNSHVLDFRGSLFGVWQDVLFPSNFDTSLLDPTFQKNGTFAGAVAQLDYAFNRQTDNAAFFVSGRGWVADYSVNSSEPVYGADVGTSIFRIVPLTRRMSLAGAASASYSPYFNLTPTPAGQLAVNTLPTSVTPGLNVGALNASNVMINAFTGVNARLSRRSDLSANLLFQQTFFLGHSDVNLTQLGSQLLYHRQVFRKLGFHVGYTRTQSRTGTSDRWSDPLQSFDVGLDYADALVLQLSRRTTLSFGVALGSARAIPGTTQYRVLGNANLMHSIGRTWFSGISFSRSLGFLAAFEQPALVDTATGTFGGQLATRLSWSSSVSWTRGYIGLDQSKHYDSDYASSVLMYAISRNLEAFAQYSYFRNRLPTALFTLPIPINFDRQAVSVGFSLFDPIFNTQRKP
jgi:hypothetical protein